MTSRPISIDHEDHLDDDHAPPSGNRIDERLLMGRLRRELLRHASGTTLDLACGDGVNFRHYPDTCDLTAGDIDRLAVTKARAAARHMGRPIDVLHIDAQAIPFPDNAFATVVSSMALCSYPDPIRALDEMSRVCRPDGRVLLLEHGRSRFRLWAKWQDYQERLRGPHSGCHQNREPLELVLRAGMHPVAARRTWFGMIHLITAKPAA